MTSHPQARIWAALLTLYFVWGSTYLAIRVGVESLPPFLMAETRFALAGAILYAFAIRRGDREGDRPTAAGWRAAAVVGAGLCLGGNGGVVWAEQYVTSGLAALIVSTLPLWMALLGRVFFGLAISSRVIVGLVLGLGGVVLLVGPVETGGAHVMGALALDMPPALGDRHGDRGICPRALTPEGNVGDYFPVANQLEVINRRVRPERQLEAQCVRSGRKWDRVADAEPSSAPRPVPLNPKPRMGPLVTKVRPARIASSHDRCSSTAPLRAYSRTSPGGPRCDA